MKTKIGTPELFQMNLDIARCDGCGKFHREAENNEGKTVKVGEDIADAFMEVNKYNPGAMEEMQMCINILQDFVDKINRDYSGNVIN